jgi:hypothetical protein
MGIKVTSDSGCMFTASFRSVLTITYHPKNKLQKIGKNPKRSRAHFPYSVSLPAPLPSSALMVLL